MNGRRFFLTSRSIPRNTYCFSQIASKIVVGGREFCVPRELSVFISPFIYRHFRCFSSSLDISSFQGQGSLDSIISALEKVLLLINGRNFIEIGNNDRTFIKILSKCFKNQTMESELNGEQSRFTLLSSFILYEKPCEDFTFEVCGNKYGCPKVLAAYLSEKACAMLASDSCAKSFGIKPPCGMKQDDFKRSFEAIFSLLSGSPIEIDESNARSICEVSYLLGNSELLEIASTFINDPIKQPVEWYFGKSSYVHKLASGFRPEKLRCMHKQTIIRVLESSLLRIGNEAELLDFIMEIIRENGMNYTQLLFLVKYEYISVENMKIFAHFLPFWIFTFGLFISLKKTNDSRSIK